MTQGKNPFYVGVDSDQEADQGYYFLFFQHCDKGHLSTFQLISQKMIHGS